ncbi:MAG: MFS transporter, partial [Clostridia bacterium]|nr:MFS transporter [Clostridia bacterium]
MENTNLQTQPKRFVGSKESWALALAGLGQGMMYSTMSSYISDFYINIMGLPLVFVLLLMLLARVWDAINDPLMGIIVDRTKPRKIGKMKPFIIWFAIPIAVATFLMFYAPEGFNVTQNMIYAGVIYIAWGMLYTAADVPFWALPNVMTPDPEERGGIISFAKTVNGVGSAVPMAIFMILSWIPYFSSGASLQAEKQKYMVIALVCSLIGTALYLLAFFYPKERVIIPPKAKKDPNEPGTLKRIFTCKPLMLVVLCGVLSSGRYMMQAAAIHVARYAFYIGPSLEGLTGDALQNALSGSVGTVSTIFQICSAIGMFGSMLAMPLLYKKFNYKQIIIVSCLGGFVASIATTVLGACSIYTSANWLVYLMI